MLLFLKQEIRWVMVLCVDMPCLFSGARMPGWLSLYNLFLANQKHRTHAYL